MADAGEGLIDAQNRIQERMDEREEERARRAMRQSEYDPEQVRRAESLRLAYTELSRQLEATTHNARRQQLTSALTGRTMSEIANDDGGVSSLAGKSGDAFAKAMATTARHNRKVSRRTKAKGHAKTAAFGAVLLATLVDSVPSGNDWFHEIKFDGYRALVAASGDAVKIYTRTGQDWTDKFVPLRDAIAALDLPSCLIDGEITWYADQERYWIGVYGKNLTNKSYKLTYNGSAFGDYASKAPPISYGVKAGYKF